MYYHINNLSLVLVMSFDIDIAIVIVFLGLTLAVGLRHGNSVKTIKDYALGGRNFSTTALVATIVATQASGSGFFTTLSKTYSDGFYYMFASLGVGISIILTAFLLIPRMGEFLGKVSIAEAMGDLYGNQVRLITAISGTIGSAGLIAVQFKVFGEIVAYFTGIDPNVSIIISGMIVTIYSAFGGIRAVTFTDILQGFTFGVIIPMLGFAIWSQFYNADLSLASAISDPKFNLDFLVNSSNDNFWNFIFLFILLSIPAISVPTFQRIAMGNNIAQVKKAFIIAALIFVIIKFAIAWIPFLIHAMNPGVESNQLLGYIVNTYSFTGLKGLVIVAIIAFAMSTADSYINSSSVLFTHDIYGLFTRNRVNELFVARVFTCALGFGTIILSLIETDLLGIIVFANSFYFPLVAPPFLLAIFGFRTSTISVLIGMFAGLSVTILWKFLPDGFLPLSQNIIGFLFAMFCNIVCLIGSHYLLRQPGGWVGIKDTTYLDEQKIQKQQRWDNWAQSINNFSIRDLCNKIAPHTDLTYTSLGFYFIVCTITTMYSTQVELLGANAPLMKIIYPLMLVSGTGMAMYQIWPLSVENRIKEAIIEIWYPIVIFYMLIFFSCFFVLVSKFATLQVLLFGVNLIVAALLLGWRLALPAIIIGFYTSTQFYQHFFGGADFSGKFSSPEFLLIYMVLFLGSTVIVFLKPKQEYIEATESKVDSLEYEVIHLDHEVEDLSEEVEELHDEVTGFHKKMEHFNKKISDKDKEIERLGFTAQKILNNVNHELRLPIGNVMNFAAMLNDGLGKFDEAHLKTLADEVCKNSNRLSSMILNMLDLATLDIDKIGLKKKTINYSELVENRVRECRKIYLDKKPIKFKLTIDPEIMISVDPNYMRQAVDNLVINAIKFSKQGTIEINVHKQKNSVLFTIEDQGIGIPKNDIFDIFTPFKIGSNTESKAEGRGVGLALCKSVIDAHDGAIMVESEDIGATFRFTLPIRQGNKLYLKFKKSKRK